MKLTFAIVAGIVIALIVLMTVWRLGSRRYTLPCSTLLNWLVELDNPFIKTNHAAFIVENLDITEGMSVLDAGCGPGRLTIPLARHVGNSGRIVAMDIQAGMIARTKAKAESAGLTNIDFLLAGLGEGKLPHNAFDRVALVTVLGEIPNREAAMTELFQAVKPGGVLAVVELIFDPHFQSRHTVATLAQTVGFEEKAFFGNRIAYNIHFQKPHND